jgi:putative SOS response-associated peptidase YedK
LQTVLHGLIQKARLDAISLVYRVVPAHGGYELQEPHEGLWRWKRRAWFARKADLEAFLLAQLTQTTWEDRP